MTKGKRAVLHLHSINGHRTVCNYLIRLSCPNKIFFVRSVSRLRRDEQRSSGPLWILLAGFSPMDRRTSRERSSRIASMVLTHCIKRPAMNGVTRLLMCLVSEQHVCALPAPWRKLDSVMLPSMRGLKLQRMIPCRRCVLRSPGGWSSTIRTDKANGLVIRRWFGGWRGAFNL